MNLFLLTMILYLYFLFCSLQGPYRLNDSSKSILLNKDNLSYLPLKADKFNDFSYNGRSIIKEKYLKTAGIYLWLNNINSRSYV